MGPGLSKGSTACIKACLPPPQGFIERDLCVYLVYHNTPAGSKCDCLPSNFLTGKRRRDHVSPVLHSLQWLPAHNQIDFRVFVCWLLKLLMGWHRAPAGATKVDQPFAPECTRLQARDDRAFVVAAPNRWNSSPFQKRSAATLECFKKKVNDKSRLSPFGE